MQQWHHIQLMCKHHVALYLICVYYSWEICVLIITVLQVFN